MQCFFVFDDHTDCDCLDGMLNVTKVSKISVQFKRSMYRLIDPCISMSDWKPYVMSFYANLEDECRTFNTVQRKDIGHNIGGNSYEFISNTFTKFI